MICSRVSVWLWAWRVCFATGGASGALSHLAQSHGAGGSDNRSTYCRNGRQSRNIRRPGGQMKHRNTGICILPLHNTLRVTASAGLRQHQPRASLRGDLGFCAPPQKRGTFTAAVPGWLRYPRIHTTTCESGPVRALNSSIPTVALAGDWFFGSKIGIDGNGGG